ncbi:MAG: riboflavin synthase [Gaiellaceae bacterium]
MFTGLIRETGRVEGIDRAAGGMRVTLEAPLTARDAGPGDSVAVDGVCLTVVSRDGDRLAFDAVPETLARTSLDTLNLQSRVNLEPALRVGEPLGGHYVQGHVDGVGTVRGVEDEGNGRRVRVEPPEELLRYVVEKGSICVQGTSLTVAEVDATCFAVALVPHTLQITTLGELAPGAAVNLEVDVLAKYVEKLIAAR